MSAVPPVNRVPDHGAHLRLRGSGLQSGPRDLELVLDLRRGLLHVLREDGAERWEGRAKLDAMARAQWAMRLSDLSEAASDHAEVAPSVARLSWRLDSVEGQAPVQARALPTLRTRAREGSVAFARDLCALALGTALDHPLAARALHAWNERHNFAATVQFADGSPRRVRLLGIVDEAGLRNLRALERVLRADEPLLIDLTGCASLGRWDPSGLIAGHPVAWVGVRGGVADHLRELGVPRDALHANARSARSWLRG